MTACMRVREEDESKKTYLYSYTPTHHIYRHVTQTAKHLQMQIKVVHTIIKIKVLY